MLIGMSFVMDIILIAQSEQPRASWLACILPLATLVIPFLCYRLGYRAGQKSAQQEFPENKED